MSAKPRHLGPEYVNQFKDTSIVAAYQFRPGYPPEVFTQLERLLPPGRRRVLDIGCGSGNVARILIERVESIDAADYSAAMLAEARRLPNGDHPAIRWIKSSVEDTALTPAYGLVTAGASLHWMDWEIVLPKLRRLLAPDGMVTAWCITRFGERLSGAILPRIEPDNKIVNKNVQRAVHAGRLVSG